MKNLIVILLTFVLINSCQTEKKEAVVCNLYVRYEADGQKLRAEADFSTGTTEDMKPFSPSGGVAFLGSNMTSQNLPDGKLRYVYEYSGALPGNLTLKWNQSADTPMLISIPAVSIPDFTFTKTDKAYELKVSESGCKPSDQVVLLFTDANNQKVNLDLKVSRTGQSAFLIPRENLSSLTKGEATLALVLTRTNRIEQPSLDCLATYSYYGIERPIQL